MIPRTYQAATGSLLSAVTCEHVDCDRPATDVRGGWAWCVQHLFWHLQQEQDAPVPIRGVWGGA